MDKNLQVLSELTSCLANTDKKVDALDARVVKLFSYIYGEYSEKINSVNSELEAQANSISTNKDNLFAIQTTVNKALTTQDKILEALGNIEIRLKTLETKEALTADKVNELTGTCKELTYTSNKLTEEFCYTYNYINSLIPDENSQVVLLKPVTGIYKFADKLTKLFCKKDIQAELDHQKRIKEITDKLAELNKEKEKFKSQQEQVLELIETERKDVQDLKSAKQKSKDAKAAMAMILDNIY